ncbi:MAG: hypothetical protein IPF84_03555 [Proteobacteria bacterium]|nr:hypothetical protein [Pseudomonadota bacterium]
MKEHPDDRDEAELERHARNLFQASVDDLDAATRSRLHRSRQQALDAAAGRKRTGWRWTVWVPAGALAASVLAAALLLRSPSETGAPEPVAVIPTNADAPQDPLELLTAGEDLDLATEADLEFYAWVELATADDGVG